jgi:hypothetical protein
MKNMTQTISTQLVKAYRKAHYFVHHGEEVYLLKVGEVNHALSILLQSYGACSAAFLTAYNPYSQMRSLDENQAAHEKLLAELAQSGIETIDGLGTDPHDDWDAEPSVLALGLTRSHAEQLADQYGQNAFLWIANANALVNLKLRYPLANPSSEELEEWLEGLPKPLQGPAQQLPKDERNWLMTANEKEQHHWLAPNAWDWNIPWPQARPDGCAISLGTELDRMFKLTSNGLEKFYP